MPRFKIADKKAIAKYQKQEVWEYDDWTGEPTRIVGYRCKICRREFPLDILEVDHIRPRARGGTDLPSNLRLLCPPCNKKKGSKVKKTTQKTVGKVKKTTKKTVAKSLTKKAPRRTKSKRKV
jgi:5-methylcytosine-specific restriction endonuclease McrA